MKIKNFDEYENMLFEYRTPGAKNKSKMLGPNTEVVDPNDPQPSDTTIANVGKNVVKLDNYDDFKGLQADENASDDAAYDIEAPEPEDRKYMTDAKHWTKSFTRVFGKMRSKNPFFVQGEAGWGKTTVIKNLAKKCGYHVIVLYLHQMQPEDLEGLRAIKEDATGRPRQVNTFPVWAQYMWDNKDKQFVLFLDEMNQASNAVMNALMPIVLDHKICGKTFKNFFCCGAGNMSYENENGLEDIPRPLMSRMGSRPIAWICSTKEAWEQAFGYLHKEYDNKLSKKLVDEFETWATADNGDKTRVGIFASPRDIENGIFKHVIDYKESFSNGDEFDEMSRYGVDEFYDDIMSQTYTIEGVQAGQAEGFKADATTKKGVRKLAEACYDFVNESNSRRKFNDDTEENKDSTHFNEDAVDKDQVDKIINSIAQGTNPDIVFEHRPEIRVPVTRETIYDIFPGMTKTFLDSIEAEMKKRKVEWKYPSYTDAVKDKSRNEWKTYDWDASMFEGDEEDDQ